MRIIAAALIAAGILGGMRLYMQGRTQQVQGGQPLRMPTAAVGHFSVDVTLSFAPTAEDPFAVAAGSTESKSALRLSLNGRQLLGATQATPAGEPIAVMDVSGIVIGDNEFLVEADPPLDEANRAHAVRVRVLRDGQPIAEQTFWSEPGTRLVARFRLNVPAARTSAEEAHHD